MDFVLATFLALFPSVQDQEDPRVRRILERVDQEIRRSRLRLRDDIRRILREELGKLAAPKPGPEPPRETKKRAYLGVTADEFKDEERRALGVTGGLRVAEVRGPAEKAGLKAGDILLSVGGTPVTEENLPGVLERLAPGNEVEVKVMRGNAEIPFKVRLGERKE